MGLARTPAVLPEGFLRWLKSLLPVAGKTRRVKTAGPFQMLRPRALWRNSFLQSHLTLVWDHPLLRQRLPQAQAGRGGCRGRGWGKRRKRVSSCLGGFVALEEGAVCGNSCGHGGLLCPLPSSSWASPPLAGKPSQSNSPRPPASSGPDLREWGQRTPKWKPGTSCGGS